MPIDLFQWAFFSSITKKEDIAITNSKPSKYITYRQPKLSTTAKQVLNSLLNTSSNAAQSTFKALAKHQSETNRTNQRYINIMEKEQSINFILADSQRIVRRMQRANKVYARWLRTGKKDGYLIIILEWLYDHTLFLLDLLWGVIEPMISALIMMIVHILLVTLFGAGGLYILYKLIVM